MLIADSAKKHGISEQDIVYVYENASSSLVLQQNETEIIMLFGFDTKGRGLEVAYTTTDSDNDVIIHAMKIRQKYKKYLYNK